MKTVLTINEFKFLIEDDGSYIKKIEFLEENSSLEQTSLLTPLQEALKNELQGYFNGELKKFSIPFKAEGSEFQRLVWKQMGNIEYGKMMSYGELALHVGGLNYSRAVGGACNKNPLPILIPCHRVSASNHLGGFAFGMEMKKNLLKLERVQF
ncbi:methylated-DNA--[protein]-cysteine S-methyltransferase [Bacteriovorax sp. Seq25_V]|uniref:methylated-DNA--[protein]-cysteine S-methyltransferase n=1 Tax=Bacteriovorax sp. Seq25_V TaxID=1201288 RepID=UPI00038A4B68|nr:methylated-DNA--[protein]-cysteine S-methyltransferase [Bacteriovorax sp. Seq25_V]EQC46662.1 DNA-binding protein, methylated-DNA-[protein]-cysteine S-methyltransferase family [Bacteriovorax sp. Seq25_V]